jgi:hypothetical protein
MLITRKNLPDFAAALVWAYIQAARKMPHRASVSLIPVQRHEDAPCSLLGLRKAVWAGVLPICTADCEHSIYGIEGNYRFRIFHDLGHLAHGLDMDHADELTLHVRLWALLLPYIPEDLKWYCNVLYQADTTCQSWFHHYTSEFPTDQTEFCLAVAQDINTGSICAHDAVLRYLQVHHDTHPQRRAGGGRH